MNLEYRKYGDYYIPNVAIPNDIKDYKIGKYGHLRLNYLKNNKKAEYTLLLMDNKLQEHLSYIDNQATERLNILMKQFIEQENITEKLKATNQLEWVSRMNNIKNRAEEIIFNELIYV